MHVLPVRSGELPPGVVTYSRVYTSTETLLTRQAILTDAAVTGALSGTLGLASVESVLVTTGLFTGKGFAKGEYQAILDGVSYSGNWQGVLSFMQEEKLYLNGSTSGGVSAAVEGFLSESVPGSGVYDHYQAAWKVGKLGETVTSVTLEISGNLTPQGEAEYPAQPLEILQAGIDGVLYGHYAGPASVVMTLLRVAGAGPYQGEGFSYMTYSAEPGAGESWSYAVASSPGKTALEGLMRAPLYGILHGMLDETRSPSTLSLSVERVDLGLPPAADLKVAAWGPDRISPGQTINYLIEYRNDGVKAADDALIFAVLDAPAEFVSASPGWEYDGFLQSISWEPGSLPPGASGMFSLKARIPWGLAQGTVLGVSAYIVDVESSATAQDRRMQAASLFVNGIDLKFGTAASKKYAEFSRQQGAAWVPVFYSGNVALDVLHVDNATPYDMDETMVIATDYNGLTQPLVTDHNYDVCYAYSGGTRTVVTAIRLYNLRCRRVVLISPISGLQFPGTYRQELEDLLQNKGVEQIEIYQSDKDELRVGDLYQVKFETGAPWLTGKNIILHDIDIPGPAGRGAHWDLFMHVNQDMKGREASSSNGLSTIAVARDPNAKVGPDGIVRSGQLLTYTVEFENEGEGIAFGVYFVDTLDDDLDASTLEIGPVLGSGGQQIAGPGVFDPATRTITWFVGEVGPGQGGHAEVRVRVSSYAPPGAQVINYATVYFPSVPEITRTNGVVSVVRMCVYLPVVVK